MKVEDIVRTSPVRKGVSEGSPYSVLAIRFYLPNGNVLFSTVPYRKQNLISIFFKLIYLVHCSALLHQNTSVIITVVK